MNNIQLSAHFWLLEMCKSQVADRLGIDNFPTDQNIINSLKDVCQFILEPIRTHYNIPLTPNSGYRSVALNRAIGSKDSSQHVLGQAVDIEVPGVPNWTLATWVQNNVNFDQLILENYIPGVPGSGWVHVSYNGSNNRRQLLTINKNGTFNGLLK